MRRDLLPVLRATLGDRYAVEREIGHGGAARVFLARDAAGRAVALKVLHPELQVSVQADRFLREITLVARIDHPLVAKVLDSGERAARTTGVPLLYYVMPFIEGPTLRATLDRRRCLTVDETRRLADDLLGALAAAHAHDIVHRDVKPDNIVLSPAGAVLLDFGIARAIEASAADQLTRSGIAVGTSAYMSPEQIAASDFDGRTDLYSLGCVLFECLAARPPFTNPNESLVLQMHLNEPAPDVRRLRPDTPPALADAVARALRKTPAERWRSAAAMRDALLSTQSPTGHSPTEEERS